MPPRRVSAAEVRRALDRLAALKNDRPGRAEFALQLLDEFDDTMVVHQALAALGERPSPAAHEALVRLLRLFASKPAKDPGGLLRADILRRLDDGLKADDLPLVIGAVTAIERTPNDPAGGAVLRAAGLAALARLDSELALGHAALMLARATDPLFTSEMSGEPAVTAARLLADHDQWPALLVFAASGVSDAPAEAVGAALRGLAGAPASVVMQLVAEVGETRNEVILAGLCDLVVLHAGGPAMLARLGEFLATVASLEVYRYALAAVIASRRHDLFEVVADSLSRELNPERLAVAREILPLAQHEPAAVQLLKAIEREAR